MNDFQKGKLVNFVLTRANVDDRNEAVIDTLTYKVFGKLCTDRGYLAVSFRASPEYGIQSPVE